MTEEVFTKNIAKLEETYATLLRGESDPGQEAELRITIIDILSNMEASVIGEKESKKEFVELLNLTRDLVLEWDPPGHLFKHEKQLITILQKIIVQGKTVEFSKANSNVTEASRIKDELAALKSELTDLRSLMNNLVKEANEVSESSPQIIKEPAVTSDVSPTIEHSTESEVKVDNAVEKTVKPAISSSEKEKVETETEEPKEELPPIMEPLMKEDEPISAEEESSFQAKATIQKLSEKRDPETAPRTVLSQMKSIISEAEDETEKQISSLKQQFSEEEKKITPPTIPVVPTKDVISQSDESTRQDETADEESLVKPSEILKQQESIASPQSMAGSDPYMQLLTLEAEKYRLEKGMEKNETDFQEGLKSKLEFDENIELINKELTTIKEKIASLRKQLTS